jgi:outer membrane lipase/esterase
MNSSLQRASRPFAVLLLTSLLAACGGGDASSPADTRNVKELVSFGDSLSDIGTYNPTTADADLTNDVPVGLRFTSKPATAPVGSVWVEFFAREYDLSITPNRLVNFSGFNKTTSTSVGTPGTRGQVYALGGNGYAEGGARIDTDPAKTDTGLPVKDGLVTLAPGVTYQYATALSIKGQIAKYKAARGSFNASQLVLIQGGPNDFFAFMASVGAGLVTPDPATVAAEIDKNATSMVTQIKTLIAMGATKVVYANMPDLSVTPRFSSPDGVKTLTSSLSAGYNNAVAKKLAAEVDLKKVVIVDTAGLVAKAIASPVSFGLVNVTAMACNNDTTPSDVPLPSTTDVTKVSALTCTGKTLVAANADTNYLFADGVHPTIAGHTILGKSAAAAAMGAGFIK